MKIDAEVFFWKYEKQFLHPLIRENKMLQQQYLPEQINAKPATQWNGRMYCCNGRRCRSADPLSG